MIKGIDPNKELSEAIAGLRRFSEQLEWDLNDKQKILDLPDEIIVVKDNHNPLTQYLILGNTLVGETILKISVTTDYKETRMEYMRNKTLTVEKQKILLKYILKIWDKLDLVAKTFINKNTSLVEVNFKKYI